MSKRASGSQIVTTLCVDIGGSGIKAIVLDGSGEPISERHRLDTPRPAATEAVISTIESLANQHGEYDRVSVEFPGVVKLGVTYTAANIDPSFIGFPLSDTLAARLGRPVRVANDADVQGMAVVSGGGVELVLTLGTGPGSALFVDGRLVPNLEVAHHRFRKGRTYEESLGNAAMELYGKSSWQKKLLKAIAELESLFNFDRLYLGGGNAKKIEIELPSNVQVVSNIAGLLGGFLLWRDHHD